MNLGDCWHGTYIIIRIDSITHALHIPCQGKSQAGTCKRRLPMPEWVTETPWWVGFGIVIALVTIIVKISRWTAKVDGRLTDFEKKIEDLSSVVKDGLAEVRKDIKDLFHNQRTAVQSNSPVELTEFGEEISATVPAKAWVAIHAPGLVTKVSGKEEFEICVAYNQQRMESDAEYHRMVRFGAYQHGTETDQVKKVLEVELRDKVLELTSLGYSDI